MPKHELPELLEIPRKPTPIKAVRVGYGSQGIIYRAVNGQDYYRLLPSSAMTMKRRVQIQEWMKNTHSPCFAQVVSLNAPTLDPVFQGYYMLQYTVKTEIRPLPELLAQVDTIQRLQAFISILQAFSQYPKDTANFLPYPADILITSKNEAVFLGIPEWADSDLLDVSDNREQVIFLTPQHVRGLVIDFTDAQWYALGCLLWLCCHHPKDLETMPRFLEHLASGTALKSPYFEEDAPFWMRRIDAYHKLIQLANDYIDTNPEARLRVRSLRSPSALLNHISQIVQSLEPRQAVKELRIAQRYRDAIELIRTILLTNNSYDLLLLAAEIAAQDLKEYLEAIDFLENAIMLEPEQETAYIQQFNLLVENHVSIFISELFQQAQAHDDRNLNLNQIFEQFAQKVERNYSRLSEENQTRREEQYAMYLVWRGKLDEASRFIYPRLFDENNKHLWWKLGLNLTYLEIFIKKGRYDEADSMLKRIRGDLIRLRENGHKSPEELRYYGRMLTQLEAALLNAKNSS